MLNFETIANAPLTREPFPFMATPGVLSSSDLADVRRDFPKISSPGVFPLSELTYGPAFAELINDIQSTQLEDILADKYGIELAGKPLMITVRGQAQKKDGRIHTDSKTKFLTCLLYLNEMWDEGGGRLRLLRNGTDLNDYVAEISPSGGTLATFKRTDISWHGHERFVGERRYVMFNWMTSKAALEHDLSRHSFSAKLKRLNPFA